MCSVILNKMIIAVVGICCVVRAMPTDPCRQTCMAMRTRFSAYQTLPSFLDGLYEGCASMCISPLDRSLHHTRSKHLGAKIPLNKPRQPYLPPTQPSSTEPQCGKRKMISSRIIGGNDAEECEFPWQTAITYNIPNKRHKICGGSILDSRHILTAAHCLKESDNSDLASSDVTVQVGSSNLYKLTPYRVKHLDIHKGFNATDTFYDVAVITLASELIFNLCVSPICLPNEGDEVPDICTSSGWGLTEPPSYESRRLDGSILQTVDLPVVNNSLCSTSYSNIADLKMCAGDFQNGGIDTCTGDSGGPLVCQVKTDKVDRYVQYGIVSSGKSCGEARFPGVYTNVANREILSFIRYALKNS